MKIALSGGEKGTFRNILIANKAPRIALNLTQYNVPKTKVVDLRELLGGAEVYVYTSDGDEDTEKFDLFIREHADEITTVIGRPDYNGDWLGDKYVPLWNDDKDTERLAHLCQKYGRVAISDRAITAKTLPRIKQLQQRWSVEYIGLTSKVDTIEAVDWSSVIVASWTSVVRYGETQVWDGYGLRRYPSQKKESSRKKHRSDIVRLGIDYEAIQSDDVSECAKLAVVSWLEWEKHSQRIGAYHPSTDSDEDEFEGAETGGIATITPINHSGLFPVSDTPAIAIEPTQTRHESEQLLLPVIGVGREVSKTSSVGEDGEETLEIEGVEVNTITYAQSGVRNCDSCYLASRCPAFKEHSECAYKIPVEIRTKEQLRATLTAILEMQTSRVLFAKFAEELEGQGMDPALSAEMDRLFKLVKEFKDIEDTRDTFRFEVEARSGAGVLSRIFGSKAAEQTKQLSEPIEPEDVDSYILNADILDD